LGHSANGGQELRIGGRFGEVTQGPGLEGLEEVSLALVHGENQNTGFRAFPVNAPSRLKTAHILEANIQENHLGPQFQRPTHRLGGILGLAYHFHIGRGVHQELEAGPHHGVVFH